MAVPTPRAPDMSVLPPTKMAKTISHKTDKQREKNWHHDDNWKQNDKTWQPSVWGGRDWNSGSSWNNEEWNDNYNKNSDKSWNNNEQHEELKETSQRIIETNEQLRS